MSQLTEEQFIELVKKSEAEAAANIDAYKTKLALFALLGYAVIFAVLGILVLLVGGTIGLALVSSSLFLLLVKKKLIIVVLVAIWTFLRALWVKFSPPTGYELQREDYPELFREIDHLTRELNALKIHQVIIDNNLNAAVVQTPRFGLFGGQQNTLMLGLQLLLALSPDEMRAVLAHEFGHLSGNHSRFSGWIYRVRITWGRVMAEYDNSDSFGAGLMRKFFDWYAPTFSAYSFALARNNEYEADRVAAELTSPQTAAKALVNVHTKAPYIEKEYWDVYFRKADDQPAPPTPPFEGLAGFLKRAPISREALLGLIRENMQIDTHYADTHPALRDRVNNITDIPVLPENFDTNAAEAWLGKQYLPVLQHFDEQWLQNNAERWKERYEYVQQSRTLLADLDGRDPDSLDDETLWQLAQVTQEFKGDEAALPVYQCYQKRHPDSIGAAYCIGRILVAQRDEAALPHLRIAFNSPNTIRDAAHWGYDLLKEKGKEQQAEQWWQDALDRNAEHEAAQQERSVLRPDDTYVAPQMPDQQRALLVEQLNANKKVGNVWLARKELSQSDAPPVHIIAYQPKGLALDAESHVNGVIAALDLPFEVFVVCLKGDQKKLAKKVKRVGQKIC